MTDSDLRGLVTQKTLQTGHMWIIIMMLIMATVYSEPPMG